MENKLHNRGVQRESQDPAFNKNQAPIDTPTPTPAKPDQPEAAEAQAQNEAVARELSHDAPTIAGTAAPAGGVPDEKELQRNRLRDQARQKRDAALNADAVSAGKLSAEAAALEKQAAEA